VWDSDAAAERRESDLKARILTARHPEFDLLETMLWTPLSGFALVGLHLRRLVRAAEYFGYACDPTAVRDALAQAVARLPSTPHRVRLLVARRGGVQAVATALDPSRAQGFADPVLDVEAVDPDDPFLCHKTTHRAVYAAALARNPGAADVLLRTARGEVTEGTLANLVYRLDGRLWTPPADSGLLPGTYREWVLAVGRVRERPLRVDELDRTDALFFANSVRGLHRIRLLGR
jgi:para-aminobenzoate synthetase/4-amino-4-deoxychorismate lyase